MSELAHGTTDELRAIIGQRTQHRRSGEFLLSGEGAGFHTS
ncbi:hypothetical protein [Cupriavidus sp. D39]|nr:hypothetical protein [Cupriavidus sp. D39]MCY0854653.1 hypothetical protein [Cupriavidus sp. D39]